MCVGCPGTPFGRVRVKHNVATPWLFPGRGGYDWFPIVFDVAECGRPGRAPLHFCGAVCGFLRLFQSFLMARRAGAPNGRPYILRVRVCGPGFVGPEFTFFLRVFTIVPIVFDVAECGRPERAPLHFAGPGSRVPGLRGDLRFFTIVPIVFDVAECGRPERSPLHFAGSGFAGSGFAGDGCD